VSHPLPVTLAASTQAQIVAGVFGAIALVALRNFFVRLRRDRVVADTPLSRIRSAAQGYVKVAGRAGPAGENPTAAPLSSRPCVWWSYEVAHRETDSRGNKKWSVLDKASSTELFGGKGHYEMALRLFQQDGIQMQQRPYGYNHNTWVLAGAGTAATYDELGSERAAAGHRRSLYVAAPVRKGERLTAANVRSVRPGFGLAPKHLPRVLGRRATRDLAFGEPLAWNMVEGAPDA